MKREREFVKLVLVLTALSMSNERPATGQITESNIAVGSVTATEPSFLTPAMPAPGRNNFSGAIGFQFQVSQSITVTSLGRYFPSAGSSHAINLWTASNTAAPLATATVSGSGPASIVYATITPVTLIPGTVYAITIDETNGGDLWVDDWVPGGGGAVKVGELNGIITNFRGAYALTQSKYPSFTSIAGYIYDTPAMIFTTNEPLLSSGVNSNLSAIPGSSLGPTTVVTAVDSTTPMMYFMRPSSGASPSIWPVGSYIGAQGNFESNAWIVLAGDASITMPYAVSAMLGIYPDVPAGIIFEAPSILRGYYAYGVLDYFGNFRFSQQYDGSHCWGNGANANQSLNDVCLARPASGALEVNTGTVGSYAGTQFKAGGNVLDNNGVTLVGVSQPVCAASLAGKLWYSGHATGVKDSAAICAADATNTFAWRTLY
jgi:hypothetical protein